MPTPPAADADHQPKAKRRHRTRTGPERTPIKTHLVAVLRADLRPLRFLISGDRERWLPLRLWLHIALFFGIAVASVFVLWVVFEGVLSPGLKDELKVEVIRLILFIIAGIGGVFALVIAYRRQGLNEAAEVRIERAEAREESKVFNERFKSASEQMSSDHAANRLAGVYAMAGLADDWDQGRQTCISVLCAYLRMPFDPPTGEPLEDLDSAERIQHRAEEQARRQEAQVRETIVNVIASRLRDEQMGGRTWHGYDFDFTGAHFDDADFSGIRVTGGLMSFRKIVHAGGRLDFNRLAATGGRLLFDNAVFSGGEVDFSIADISGGTVSFLGTAFTEGQVRFDSASFYGGNVRFNKARFIGGHVDFSGVRFVGCIADFYRAEFSGGQVGFPDAEFSGGRVGFNHARFSGGLVGFGLAHFSGSQVVFTNAEFSGSQVEFTDAAFSGGRVDYTGAGFTGGEVLFTLARFSGGQVDFALAAFLDCQVGFSLAEFSGTQVHFSGARFYGGNVSLVSARFRGGQVDFTESSDVASRLNRPVLPQFAGGLPECLLLPASWIADMPEQSSEPDSPVAE